MAPRPLRFRAPGRRDTPKAKQYRGKPEAGGRHDVFSATKGLAGLGGGKAYRQRSRHKVFKNVTITYDCNSRYPKTSVWSELEHDSAERNVQSV
jgi:hypothetical protein